VTALAQHETVQGMILPVENDVTVAQAYTAWDSNGCSPAAANSVAQAIKALVDQSLHAYPSIRYLVIVGGDEILPHRRVPDRVAIGNERTYSGRLGVQWMTPTFHSFDTGYTLTDDYYADQVPFAWFGRELYVPDYPIGRLVEEPGTISRVIDVYLQHNGQATADSALVVGYDFLTDAALEIKSVLEGQGIATTSLISDTWTASQMQEALLTAPHDLNSLNGHFEHWRAIPADLGSGQLSSLQVFTSSADLSNALLFSVGCHAGLNVPDCWAGPGLGLDFSQAFAAKGSTWVGNTGYGYGMDDVIALSEQLMVYFTRELLDGAPSVGDALVRAKQRYVNSAAAASLGLYDEKILIESTLYGLPMSQVNVPSLSATSSPAPDSQPFTVSSNDPLDTEPIRRTVTITPTFTEVSTDIGRYFSIDSQVVANGGRPVQPRMSLDISEADTEARSVLFIGGSYSDLEGFDPVISRPVTDTGLAEPSFLALEWYPAHLAVINRVPTANELLERLVVVPGQYRNPGTERLWTELTFDITYSTAADHTLPTIWQVNAGQTPWAASFAVDVTDDSAVQSVVVTYSLGDGRWRSLDLAPGGVGDTWRGALPLSGGEQVVGFLVQAVDTAGNIARTNNKGLLFEPMSQIFLPVIPRSHSSP